MPADPLLVVRGLGKIYVRRRWGRVVFLKRSRFGM